MHHIKNLVKYVEQEGVIETYDDIPNTIYKQLYTEKTQQLKKQKKSPNHSATRSICPLININVLPV